MNVEFIKAKDGNSTFSADKVFFHSTYSPVKEAERFVQGTSFQIKPKIIFFLEPGFSYCAPLLQNKYDDCKIVCVRFFDKTVFFEDQIKWDYVINFSDLNDIKSFNQIMLNTFSEEKLLTSAVLIWKPAENIFQDKIQSFFEQYKKLMQDCKTLLVTRQFFEKKWLVNCCNFIFNARHFIHVNQIKTKLPVVVCASGPSLMPCLPLIKQNADKLFIVCLSSAVSVLINNSIIPDIVLTTDGGYWAGQHLKALKQYNSIPVAAPVEAFIPKSVLRSHPIIALKYNDSSSFISSSILKKSGLPAFEAVRNPTVSGTALFFANAITSAKVYFCGLDLSAQPGFQHSEPNELEKNNSINDTRIKTKALRNCRSAFNCESLEIYKNWFSSLDSDTTKRTVRIIDSEYKNNSLGNIKDISSNTFNSELLSYKKTQDKKHFIIDDSINIKNKSFVFDFILSSLKTQKWQHQIFPADYISMSNAQSEEEKQKAGLRLNEKFNKLTDKIRMLPGE